MNKNMKSKRNRFRTLLASYVPTILTAIRATSRHCKMPSMKPRNISLHTPLLTQAQSLHFTKTKSISPKTSRTKVK